ncbi:MAG: L-fuculose kinase, partial [Rhizobacter sp.]
MTRDHTLVVDIGKSNARVLVIDADGAVVGQSARANASTPGPGYTALGVAVLQAWLLDAVPQLPSRERVGRVIVSTHGAAFCAIDDQGLVLPPIDYEWDGYGPHRAGFEERLDPFTHTGSPRLPMGLNAGLQLHWVQAARPDDWARIRHWLPYPQYWAWWLTGVAASEVSSLGCHTQLWSPAEATFSRWARSTGIAEKFAPVRPAWEVLGTLTPSMA